MLGESLQTLPGLSDSNVSTSPVDGRVPGHRAVRLEHFLTTAEVSNRLGLAEAVVYRRVKEGRLHPVKRKNPVRRGPKYILVFNPDEVENELARMHELFKARPSIANRIGKGGPTPKLKNNGPPTKAASASAPTFKSKEKSILPPTVSPPPPKKSDEESEGERCARAVKLFREGKQQLDAVVEMGLTFERARYYWECYLLAQPGWLLAPKALARIRALIGWNEEPPSPEGFERALIAHVARQLEQTPESSEDGKGPGIELQEEDRVALAELERELAASKKKVPVAPAKPPAAPPLPAASLAPPASSTPEPTSSSEPHPPMPTKPLSSLAALASFTNLNLAALAQVK